MATRACIRERRKRVETSFVSLDRQVQEPTKGFHRTGSLFSGMMCGSSHRAGPDQEVMPPELTKALNSTSSARG